MSVTDTINAALREHNRYTGDGQPNEPVGAPLPVGDPRSGIYNPKKAEIRDALLTVAQTTGNPDALGSILQELNSVRSDLANGRTYTQYTGDPSGRNIPATAKSVICITSGNASIWTPTAQPAGGAETATVKKDNGGRWWLLVVDLGALRSDYENGRVFGISGAESPSEVAVPTSSNLVQTVHNASGSIRFWRPQNAPADGRETDTIKKDGSTPARWWTLVTDPEIRSEIANRIAAVAAEAQARADADAAILAEFRDGRVFGISGAESPSGVNVPTSTNLVQTVHNASGSIRFWRPQGAPSDGLETDTVKKDGSSPARWWTLVTDPRVREEIANRIAADGLLRSAIRDGAIIPTSDIGGTGDAITANIAASFVGADVTTLSAIAEVEYIPTATNAAENPTFLIAGVTYGIRNADGAAWPANGFKVGRPYKLRRRGTTMRVVGGDVTASDMTAADAAIIAEMRDGRMFAISGGQTPSGMNIPASYRVGLLTITNNAAGTSSTWRPVGAPADGLETDTLKKDASSNWWVIMPDAGAKQEAEKRRAQMALSLIPLKIIANAANTPANTTTVEVDETFTDLSLGANPTFLYIPSTTNTAPDPAIVRGGVSRVLRGGDNQVLQAGDVAAGVPLIVRQHSTTTLRVVGSVSRQSQIAKMILPLEVINATANSAAVQLPADFIHLNTVANNGSVFLYTPTMTNTVANPVLVRNGTARTLRGPNNEEVQAGQIVAGVPLFLQQVSDVTFRVIAGSKVELDRKADKTELNALATEMRDGREHVVWAYDTPKAAPIPATYAAETVSCVYNNLSSRWRRDTAPIGNLQTVDQVQDSAGNWWRRLINMNPDGRIYSVMGETPSGMAVPSGTDRIYCAGASTVSIWRMSADQTSGVATDRVQISGGQYWIRETSLPYASRVTALETAMAALQARSVVYVMQRGANLPDRPPGAFVVHWRTYDDPSAKMDRDGDLWAPINPAPIKAFADDFERADGKLDDDERWTQVKGNASSFMVISGGTVRVSAPAVEVVDQASERLTPDHFVEAVINGSGAGNDLNTGVYLCARMPNGKNSGYRLEMRNSQWIIRLVTDTTTTVALASGNFSAVAPFTARLECVGTTIRAIIGGVVVGTVTDGTYMSGTVGVGIRASSPSTLSAYQIESLKAGAIG